MSIPVSAPKTMHYNDMFIQVFFNLFKLCSYLKEYSYGKYGQWSNILYLWSMVQETGTLTVT